MRTKVSKTQYLENDNLIMFGMTGSGKTRYLIRPMLFGLEDSNYILFARKFDTFPIIQFTATNSRFLGMYEQSDFSKNNILVYNDFNQTENTTYIKNLIDKFLQPDFTEKLLLVFDEAGEVDFTFLTKEMIKKLNEKNIYLTFIYQCVPQVNNKDLFDACKTKITYATNEINSIEYFNKYGFTTDEILNLDKQKCIIIHNDVPTIDDKLSLNSSTILKEYRISHNLTQIELAEMAEQNVRNIRAIEKDPSKIQNMSAINLYKLSKVLHCNMETLLEL